jgi:hypothetical protein
MVPAVAVEQQVDRVAERLTAEYHDRVPEPELRSMVERAYASMANSRVTTFVPVLVDRTVRATLRQQLAVA